MKGVISNGRTVSRFSASYSMRNAQEIWKLRVENFFALKYKATVSEPIFWNSRLLGNFL